jgi:hypothetical protein
MDSRSLVLGRGCSIRYLRGATKWSPGTHGNPATDRFSFSRTHCFPQVFMYPVMSQNKHDASVYHIPSGYLTWPWKITMLLIGKPSISMGHLYHGYVSHNQRVIVENLRFTRTYQSPRIAMGLRGSWGVFKVVTNPYVPRGVHWRVGHLGGKCEYFFFPRHGAHGKKHRSRSLKYVETPINLKKQLTTYIFWSGCLDPLLGDNPRTLPNSRESGWWFQPILIANQERLC